MQNVTLVLLGPFSLSNTSRQGHPLKHFLQNGWEMFCPQSVLILANPDPNFSIMDEGSSPQQGWDLSYSWTSDPLRHFNIKD